MYIMYYCSLTFDDHLIIVMLFIEMSCIIYFFHKCQISDFLVFSVTIFEAVKELHKL